MWNISLLLNTWMCVCVSGCFNWIWPLGGMLSQLWGCDLISECDWVSTLAVTRSQVNITDKYCKGLFSGLWIMNATILALNLPVVSPGVREHISAFPPVLLSLPPCLSPSVEEYSHKLLIINWPARKGSERFITLLWVCVCMWFIARSQQKVTWDGFRSVWILCRATDEMSEWSKPLLY